MLNHGHGDDRGFTLVELMVAILILGIVGGVVVTSVVKALQVTTQANQRTTALTDIERGIERVSRQIRVADPLLIDPDGACDSLASGPVCEDTVLQRRLDADTYADGKLTTFSYYLVDTADGVELRQDITTTNLDTGTVVENATGEFIADIANLETGTPLFRFLAPDAVTGELIELDCSTLADTSVDACRNAYATASVIEMTLSKTLPDSEPLTVSTRVNIRNTRYEP